MYSDNRAQKPRFIPRRRTALDGRVWWVVWDTYNHGFATNPLLFGRFLRRKGCQAQIDYLASAGVINLYPKKANN